MRELTVDDLPAWLTVLSWISLAVAGLLAVVVTVDVVRRPRPMAVMNVVWPVTMLFGSLVWFALYRRWGRPTTTGPCACP